MTSSIKHHWKSYLPYAFTEQGGPMLSSVLRYEKAALVIIAIMRDFVEIRKIISLQSNMSQQIMELKNDLEERLGEHDVQFMEIYTIMEQFLEEKTVQKKWEDRKKTGVQIESRYKNSENKLLDDYRDEVTKLIDNRQQITEI